MSQTTTYKCDRCGKESTNADELNLMLVAVGVKKERYSSYYGREYDLHDWSNRQMEMCRSCREQLGLHDTEHVKKDEPVSVAPSLEDMIREICREEITNSQQ